MIHVTAVARAVARNFPTQGRTSVFKALPVLNSVRCLGGSVSFFHRNPSAPRPEFSLCSDMDDFFELMERNEPSILAMPPSDSVTEETYLDCGIPESSLRFTTTVHGRLLMAPYVHPNEHRVVLYVRDVVETPLQKQILHHIVGGRYDPKTNFLRLSSNQFGSRVENKRHLVNTLNRIILSCKELAEQAERELAPDESS